MCESSFTTWECKLKNGNGRFCSKQCFNKHQSVNVTEEIRKRTIDRLHKIGPEHPSWKNGRTVNHRGYVEVWVEDHPRLNRTHRVLEHRLVMEKHLGRYLEKNEIVHHKDRNKQNNNIENLELVQNIQEHMDVHMMEKYNRPKSTTGWAAVWDCCIKCGTTSRRHQGKGKCDNCYKYDRLKEIG